MKGFFDLKQNSKIDINKPQSCASCGLYQNCKSPRMKPYGNFAKKVLILGDAPSDLDDKRNQPWQGRVGRHLQRTLKSMGFDIFEDALCVNACHCKPMDDESPTPHQIYCCRKRVMTTIKRYQPNVILLLGSIALQSIIGGQWNKGLGGIDKWRGFHIPDRQLNAWICPTHDPAFVLKKEESGGANLAMTIWKQDLLQVLKHIDKELPTYHDESKDVTYLKNAKELKLLIPDFIKADLLSFDYETTGIKPHRKEQELVSVSAVIGEGQAYGWMNDKAAARLFAKVLKSKVPKTAHNLQFEDVWSAVKLNTKVQNWKWCSMNAAHVLDNRRGITSLKFQTYINFGVADYDSQITSFLKSKAAEGANALNKIKKFIKQHGTKELLKYNTLDSIYGFKLTVKQMNEIGI